ncbi:hypothetical protein OUZ56_024959 [Daphnia magna]|uniref:Uncharacterized protein n=1 Tax=Daphnia magna TaxID=35525 RepID=A0ABQ9ZIH7_9CRUS|nr:hypothetical protein OUZ56_024959 [Daphnia magna]
MAFRNNLAWLLVLSVALLLVAGVLTNPIDTIEGDESDLNQDWNPVNFNDEREERKWWKKVFKHGKNFISGFFG